MSWLLTILGICVLVLLHEGGHFLAAKAVGMKVERFSLFLGPLIFKVRRGETDYGIGALPLGGYVKIAGMNPAEPLPEGEEHRGYFKQPVWKRMVVIAAGPAVNIVLAFVIFVGFYWLSPHHPLSDRVAVAALEPGKPAQGVLRKGDQLLAVDGKRVRLSTTEAPSYTAQVSADRCAGAQTEGCLASRPLSLLIRRDGKDITVDVKPAYDVKEKRMLIGIALEEVLVKDSLPAALGASASEMWTVTSESVSHLVKIFTNSKARHEVHSIVGASDFVSQAFSFSASEAFFVLGLLSLSLAIINLFPFLPLDGGHLFWALAEKLRRRPIPFSVMERASVAGIALVLIVFAIGLTNDIHSLSNGGLTISR